MTKTEIYNLMKEFRTNTLLRSYTEKGLEEKENDDKMLYVADFIKNVIINGCHIIHDSAVDTIELEINKNKRIISVGILDKVINTRFDLDLNFANDEFLNIDQLGEDTLIMETTKFDYDLNINSEDDMFEYPILELEVKPAITGYNYKILAKMGPFDTTKLLLHEESCEDSNNALIQASYMYNMFKKNINRITQLCMREKSYIIYKGYVLSLSQEDIRDKHITLTQWINDSKCRLPYSEFIFDDSINVIDYDSTLIVSNSISDKEEGNINTVIFYDIILKYNKLSSYVDEMRYISDKEILEELNKLFNEYELTLFDKYDLIMDYNPLPHNFVSFTKAKFEEMKARVDELSE